jgi:hypothetical protein
MRRLLLSGIVLLVVLAVALFVVPTFIPWSPLNCQTQEIDLRTGKSRSSRYLAFCKVSSRIDETPLSRVLPRELIASARPEWERVNTFSPGISHSPHHSFHGAFSQIRELELLWHAANVDERSRRKTAEHLLALWQFGGSYFVAGRYLEGLHDLWDESKREPLLRSIRALEMPEERADGDHTVLTVFFPDGRPMERVRGSRDSVGRFVRHGIWETWYASGKRRIYGHIEHGQFHGPSFEWAEDGSLTCIQSFKYGQLDGYETANLVSRPEYAEAQRIAADSRQ